MALIQLNQDLAMTGTSYNNPRLKRDARATFNLSLSFSFQTMSTGKSVNVRSMNAVIAITVIMDCCNTVKS